MAILKKDKPVPKATRSVVSKYGAIGTGATILLTVLYFAVQVVMREVYGVTIP